jgi:UDP-N-acetylglucosamine--N-acetylmuramyl-(pentapeptide) pyrophosphoryl-undecaprenol N-acetylglucosamine transferase
VTRAGAKGPRTILVAGGGTGGHVFPGLAVAQALRELADVEVVFAGTPRGLETRIIPQHGYPLELLDVEPMKGGGPARVVRGAVVAARALRHASSIVRRLRPSAALSVGGYAAGPAALACVLARVPLAILEPNSALGLANRLLAPFASRAYVAWSETARRVGQGKAEVYGVPLRAGFEPRAYAAVPGVRRVLVLGGSQGATALNERVPSAIARTIAKLGEVLVVHQTGGDRDAKVREAYARLGVTTVTVVPFLDDVASKMIDADVIIARAGAVTVAELASIGRASVLVPFPHAADDHQAKNALSLASLGGALCLRQEAADDVRLATELTLLLADDERRARMAEAARDHGRPHAAHDVARDLLKLAGLSPRPLRDRSMNGASSGVTHPTSKAVS